jgi:hypothetical protein
MLESGNRTAWSVHGILSDIFYPANVIDRRFFGGAAPLSEPLIGFSPKN